MFLIIVMNLVSFKFFKKRPHHKEVRHRASRALDLCAS